MADESPDKPQKNSSTLMRVVKSLAFVSVIIIVECVIGSMFLPSAAETEEIGRRLAAAEAGQEDQTDETATDDLVFSVGEAIEVSLGSHQISSYQPNTKSTLRIDLELFAIVSVGDEEEFTELYASNEHRLREQVEIVLRKAALEDLNDAGLGLIKRQILEKSNRMLGKPFLQQVVFSRFSFMEQR